MAFDLWRENAGGRARGATCNSTRIDEADARAARRELVGNRAAHDASPDNGDVHTGDSIWLRATGHGLRARGVCRLKPVAR